MSTTCEEALAVRFQLGGALYPLEPREAPFRDIGVNVRVLWPGDANGLYHHEDAQEGFFVLFGECLLVVEEQERPLRQWDYFHCPPGTSHVIVGAGDSPCVVLMIGARREQETFGYPVSAVAAKYGASASKETSDPDEAYAGSPGRLRAGAPPVAARLTSRTLRAATSEVRTPAWARVLLEYPLALS